MSKTGLKSQLFCAILMAEKAVSGHCLLNNAFLPGLRTQIPLKDPWRVCFIQAT